MKARRRTARKGPTDVEAESPPGTAILRFRHNAAGSGVSRHGHVRPGGRLVVEYDPTRLPPVADASGASGNIICHLLFHPGGQRHSGRVSKPGVTSGQAVTPRHAPFEVLVPSDATNVEVWFERRGSGMPSGWDSRHGQNYSFVVVGEGLPVPEPSVAPRARATVDPRKIRVVEDAASKEQTVMGTAARRLHTGLVVRALIGDVAAPTDVWADLHVFDAAGELIHAGNVTLQHHDSTVHGELFVWEDEIYQGSGGGSGMGVWSRPDAHTIQYRLYCQPHKSVPQTQAQFFTDGVLHEFEVPADEDVGGGR